MAFAFRWRTCAFMMKVFEYTWKAEAVLLLFWMPNVFWKVFLPMILGPDSSLVSKASVRRDWQDFTDCVYTSSLNFGNRLPSAWTRLAMSSALHNHLVSAATLTKMLKSVMKGNCPCFLKAKLRTKEQWCLTRDLLEIYNSHAGCSWKYSERQAWSHERWIVVICCNCARLTSTPIKRHRPSFKFICKVWVISAAKPVVQAEWLQQIHRNEHSTLEHLCTVITTFSSALSIMTMPCILTPPLKILPLKLTGHRAMKASMNSWEFIHT